ncbi:MAG: flagellar basal body P-ring formation protein FlgA [Bradyrhizobiaceae bacterium]|nr:MAG: flagellar basal body P-ring formation protein FlgA [Bradyrhizobiaceae bacterium]
MIIRFILVAALTLGTTSLPARAETLQNPPMDAPSAPVLKSSVTVTADVVRIGDLVDNAGVASQVAVYRSPDLGTTGSLRTAQVLETLRANQVIGVDTQGISEVSVTRASRAISVKDIETLVAKALEHRNGLGDAANLSLTFERDLRDIQLDSSVNGEIRPAITRYDARNGRFDLLFEIQSDNGGATRLRFTGTAVETVEAAVLARNAERGDVIKASDIVIERRPKAEVGNDAATRTRSVGMQLRRSIRAGQALRAGDLAKADLVTRDQAVTLIYDAPGVYLTGRGKAMDGGTEGDTVSVLNVQSKRIVQGVVIGPGQVSITIPTPRTVTASLASASPADEPTPASRSPENAE